MSVITPDDYQGFKSTTHLFSKVKRDLKSYVAAGIVDEGEFPTYVKEVLRFVGLGVYKETEAVMDVKNYKAPLPCDFQQLHAAYKCTPYIDQKDIEHLQGGGLSYYSDVNWELIQPNTGITIDAINDPKDTKLIERVHVRQIVKEKSLTMSYKDMVLLQLSPNVRRDKCSDDCINAFAQSPFEITIDDGYLYTNFSNDSVFMKYYAMPKDQDGMLMILDNETLEKTIEWYIQYQVFLDMWRNNSTPDIQQRMQYAEMKYDTFMAALRKERKAPSFVQMVNSLRRRRAVNKIVIFDNVRKH